MASIFDNAPVRIGRQRLPNGYVAILNDPVLLRAALRELIATAESVDASIKRAIVFKQIDEREVVSFNRQLVNVVGVATASELSRKFPIKSGQLHVIDSEHVRHILNRHSNAETERQRGLVGLTLADFEMIPTLIDPRNIVEFATERSAGRVIYRRTMQSGTIRLVEEFRATAGWSVKTLYKLK